MKENTETVEACEDDTTRDAALITAAQMAKHYKIAPYGTLCALSEKLGHNDATPILKQMLEESKEIDYELTKIAEKIEVAEAVS
jgi:ferritin-like metal-binding protein YciE